MKKILIVNPFGIGDVLFSTPLITALKEHWPEVSVSYVGNARTAPFLKNDPWLDKVFTYERDEFIAVYRTSLWRFLLKWRAFVESIRQEGFDVAFDLSMGSPVSLALLLAGVPRRIGYDHKGRGRWLTDRVLLKGYEGRHVVDHHLGLLDLCVITKQTPERMRFFVTPEDRVAVQALLDQHGLKDGAFVLICPGGGASWGGGAGSRRWSPEKYVQLADKIVEKAHLPIILMGDQADVAICGQVAAGMRSRAIVLAGHLGLGQSAALMQRARGVVMNDSGAMHVAAASGVRPVVIFGPVDEHVYGPWPVREQIIVKKGLPCQPCYRRFRMSSCDHRSCLGTLTVDEVFKTIEGLLP